MSPGASVSGPRSTVAPASAARLSAGPTATTRPSRTSTPGASATGPSAASTMAARRSNDDVIPSLRGISCKCCQLSSRACEGSHASAANCHPEPARDLMAGGPYVRSLVVPPRDDIAVPPRDDTQRPGDPSSCLLGMTLQCLLGMTLQCLLGMKLVTEWSA